MRNAIIAGVVGVASAMASSPMLAGEAGDWYLSPAVGYMVFDDEKDGLIDSDQEAASLGVEYFFANDWSVELLALGAEPDLQTNLETANPDEELRLERYSLNVYRHVASGNEKLTSYFGGGLGQIEYNFEDEAFAEDSSGTEGSVVSGIRYAFDEMWSLRGEIRGIYGFDDELTDGVATLGLSARLGNSKGMKPTPTPVAPPVETTADADRDGVADANDRCPGTPYRIAVDGNGCPLDADGDGVPDYRDRCPDTAAGSTVDYRGCAKVAATQEVEQVKLVVNFAFDSSVVDRSYAAEIKKVAEFLKANSGVKAQIEGHADGTGPDGYNQGLSERRANAVKAILVNQYGIPASRLSTVGYGENRPVASNETAAGRAANRRASALVKVKVK